jgi:hypothetical protein
LWNFDEPSHKITSLSPTNVPSDVVRFVESANGINVFDPFPHHLTPLPHHKNTFVLAQSWLDPFDYAKLAKNSTKYDRLLGEITVT